MIPSGWMADGGMGSSDPGTPSASTPPTIHRYARWYSIRVATTRATHARRVMLAAGRRTILDTVGSRTGPRHSDQSRPAMVDVTSRMHAQTSDVPTTDASSTYTPDPSR